MREDNDVLGTVVSQAASHMVFPHSGSAFNLR
jgi:hypothetical protein